MRFIPISCVKENMIIGKSIYNQNNSLMLTVGNKLNQKYIERTKQLGLNGVYIDDECSKDIEIKEIISEELKQKTVKNVKNLFINNKFKMEDSINNSLSLVEDMIESIIDNKNLMINMIDLKVFDDYTYYHCVNVATLSLVMGVALNLNKRDLYELGVGALLHDIGKVFIPKEILNKTSKLTDSEFKIMKTHSEEGYKYLKKYYTIPLKSYVGALQHHEKFDGTGYPDGKIGDKISLFGRIITIADIYDALTSDRPYRTALLPSEAVEYIMGGNGSMFDPKIVSIFIKKVAPYPIGVCVELSNGQKAIVTKNYEECTIRPQIRLLDTNKVIEMKDNREYLNVTIIGFIRD